jgi:hypothetical protein
MAPLIPLAARISGRLIANIALGIGISIAITSVERKIKQARNAWHQRMIKRMFKEKGLVVIVNN